jgi:hypothetical protein
MGLIVPNLENEYIISFFASGVMGPIALLVFGIRRLWLAWSRLPSPSASRSFAAISAILLNLATYNLFSWSAGPALVLAVAWLANPDRQQESNASS